MENINHLVKFLAENSIIVLVVFVLSLIANLIQVGTYLRDRRRLQEEEKEKKYLSQLVATYESVLKIAKETIDNESKLTSLKGEIENKTEYAEELGARIAQLEQMARKKLVTEAINYNLQVVANAYEEIERLRIENDELGDLPDIPINKKGEIEKEVSSVVSKYYLPKEFTFRATLLVLFLLLLPGELEKLLLPFAIPYILNAFFEAILYFPEFRLRNIVARYYGILIFLAVYGVWFAFLDYFAEIVFIIISVTSIPTILISMVAALLALLLAAPTYKEVSQTFREHYLPKYLARQA